jgi:hypothetical protein
MAGRLAATATERLTRPPRRNSEDLGSRSTTFGALRD